MKSKIDFDSYAQNYDRELRKNIGILGEGHVGIFAEYKVRIIRREIGFEPAKILEFGCGVGRNLPFLRHYFPKAEIIACDNSKNSLEEAKKISPGVKVFHFETPAEFAAKAAVFDCCLMANVLHHIPPPRRKDWLEEIRRKLSVNGELFIFEHNPFNPVTRRLVSTCPFDRDACLIYRDDCRRLLMRCGLTEKESAYTLLFPWRRSILEKIERFFGWLPLGGQYYLRAQHGR